MRPRTIMSDSKRWKWLNRGGLSLAAALGLTTGCAGPKPQFYNPNGDPTHYERRAAQLIDDPTSDEMAYQSRIDAESPRIIQDDRQVVYWDLTLQEALELALQTSDVIHDLGGRVITAPAAAPTVYDPAIVESNGQFGVEAALSAFDAQFATGLFFNKNDRPVNVPDPFGFPRGFTQDLGVFNMELSKTTAVGTQLFVRNASTYDNNNAAGQPFAQAFPSSFDNQLEAEFRQPLLQGAGLEVNRIAGPNASPGFFFGNGVVLARLNTDIAADDFEARVIDLVSQVEDAYWELGFAYAQLDARRTARDGALESWRRIKALMDVGQRGGELENESQARAQYFQFESQVQDTLSGRTNGGGVYANERRLRRMMGIPATDNRLIRPVQRPVRAKVVFDWNDILQQSMIYRVELHRQRTQIRRREMEMIAARNFLLPRLDAIGNYRMRGLGDDYLGSGPPGSGQFGSAWENTFSGDFQEWQLGAQLTVPIGFRRALSNMRNAQLNLARERAVLAEQEQQIQHELSNAIGELDRAFVLTQTNLDRTLAARTQVQAVTDAFEVGRLTFDVVVQARASEVDAATAYYRSVVDYMLAIKNTHYQKGTLLEFDGVSIGEGPWPRRAYVQAQQLRRHPRQIDFAMTRRRGIDMGALRSPTAESPSPVNNEAPDSRLPQNMLPQADAEPQAKRPGTAPAGPVQLPPRPQDSPQGAVASWLKS
jgi:outer membrane protein TolC